jgi:hypothetical protein
MFYLGRSPEFIQILMPHKLNIIVIRISKSQKKNLPLIPISPHPQFVVGALLPVFPAYLTAGFSGTFLDPDWSRFVFAYAMWLDVFALFPQLEMVINRRKDLEEGKKPIGF